MINHQGCGGLIRSRHLRGARVTICNTSRPRMRPSTGRPEDAAFLSRLLVLDDASSDDAEAPPQDQEEEPFSRFSGTVR